MTNGGTFGQQRDDPVAGTPADRARILWPLGDGIETVKIIVEVKFIAGRSRRRKHANADGHQLVLPFAM